ncbi:MAG: flagellar type III secretion system protein FliR [Syntrophomonadaceae bacterium]|jgi:flagellar biosynthetic protein FliR|nr:flagellar type III secretion system protein FliR [Syntrophomonadaceae bacterium]
MTFAWDNFFIIFLRISGLFISAPVFSSRQIPVRIKIFALLIISFCLAYAVPVTFPESALSIFQIIVMMGMELLIGCTIGFVANMIFAGIQLAGQLMDMQMGFGIVNVVDPLSGTQVPLLGNFTQAMALLLFLAVNGHHYLLQSVVGSYQLIPVMGMQLTGHFMDQLMKIMVYVFVIAIKISSPLVLTVLTADIAMGFIGRTVPQMNVFIVGMPLKILLGFVCLLMLVPVYSWVFEMIFDNIFAFMDAIVMSVTL